MVPYTNAYQQHAVNGLIPPIKATCDGDKFEKFELLKERFKSVGDKRTIPTTNNDSLETLEMMNDHSHHHHHHVHHNQENNLAQQIQQQISASITFMTVESDLKEIRDFLRTTRKRMEDKEARAKTVNDWKQLALVLDRTFFIIYFIAIIISLALMFPRK
jgi:G3E family GTPase